jgi:hypothetical protein
MIDAMPMRRSEIKNKWKTSIHKRV